MVRSRTRNPKVASSSLGPAGIIGGGSECTALSHLQYHDWGAIEQGTESPTAPRAPQHKWLPTALSCSRLCVCVHCCVCALWWDKCRAQIPSMGHHTWSYVMSLSLSQRSAHHVTDREPQKWSPPSLSSCVCLAVEVSVMNKRLSYLCLEFTANYPKGKCI